MQWNAELALTHAAHHLKRCSTPNQLQSWYALLLKTNTTQDCFLINQYITACSNHRIIDTAIFAFSQIVNPNAFVYNALIGAFLTCFRPLQALRHYTLMLRSAVPPTSYTFPPVIKSCKVLQFPGVGQCVHAQVLRNGFGSHLHLQTTMVDFYSSLGMRAEARKLFDEMPDRDGFAWSTMISTHVRAGDFDSARRVFDEMPHKNTAASNTMIHGYAEAGDVNSAEALFNAMLERDVISWTTMIYCYCKQEMYLQALEIFEEMKSTGTTPDNTTMATVISACAHLGTLGKGKEMHMYIMQAELDIDVYIASALIDMYAKCGVMERALVVFFKLQEKNLFCWSSVIDGLAYNGYAEEALAMFDKMEKEKIEPTHVIFLSVLAACAHAGLVEEGKRRFSIMTSRYGILPEIEHYGCMVDLLSRVGLLEEAQVLISSMRMQPNSVIWGALLGGCKLHKNLEIAQIAVDRLMILEPDNSGYYTLLVNMFGEANRWNEVARIRGIIKERRVEKALPGSSWIEVRKKMHQFAASDNYHPSSKQIYQILDMLDSQLKVLGHAAQLDLVV
ncbi:pentatricopeptide repeat-containing protein [Salvia divinorum]|uniref:Pentatricopeptide repeat-containing protein n=1 Tax=Salvia divinorum TaxID=28513 RepID=A0ABD1IN54_SALDI